MFNFKLIISILTISSLANAQTPAYCISELPPGCTYVGRTVNSVECRILANKNGSPSYAIQTDVSRGNALNCYRCPKIALAYNSEIICDAPCSMLGNCDGDTCCGSTTRGTFTIRSSSPSLSEMLINMLQGITASPFAVRTLAMRSETRVSGPNAQTWLPLPSQFIVNGDVPVADRRAALVHACGASLTATFALLRKNGANLEYACTTNAGGTICTGDNLASCNTRIQGDLMSELYIIYQRDDGVYMKCNDQSCTEGNADSNYAAVWYRKSVKLEVLNSVYEESEDSKTWPAFECRNPAGCNIRRSLTNTVSDSWWASGSVELGSELIGFKAIISGGGGGVTENSMTDEIETLVVPETCAAEVTIEKAKVKRKVRRVTEYELDGPMIWSLTHKRASMISDYVPAELRTMVRFSIFSQEYETYLVKVRQIDVSPCDKSLTTITQLGEENILDLSTGEVKVL